MHPAPSANRAGREFGPPPSTNVPVPTTHALTAMEITFHCASCGADYELDVPKIIERPESIVCSNCGARPPGHRSNAFASALEDLCGAMADIRDKVGFEISLNTDELPAPWGKAVEEDAGGLDGGLEFAGARASSFDDDEEEEDEDDLDGFQEEEDEDDDGLGGDDLDDDDEDDDDFDDDDFDDDDDDFDDDDEDDDDFDDEEEEDEDD